ncbi:hypothetical protein F511_13683 [Dorcoceras hygrometricum]|uniref:O-fucosyltransferase family protein n=1 Tax=Dorcoceras hygrometricum TaxID=472368 RepID=A0A2Z7B4K4_9LAMI|nr:hypothetical protein F511_13683 [Dorcoceras hygrometricum]
MVVVLLAKRRWRTLVVLRRLLICGIGTIAVMALLSANVVRLPAPTSHKLPKHENGFQNLRRGRSWMQELAPPQLKDPIVSREISQWGAASGNLILDKLWKQPPNRDYVPCTEPSSSYIEGPPESRGYLLVHANGGLNQMRAGICDMVAVARLINATLLIPELDKRSLWQDSSNFSDVFDEDHFINSLVDDVKIVRKLPKELASASRVVKYFRSWSGIDYYVNEISTLWEEHQVIRAAKSDSRLANNNLPQDIQRLRCRACYQSLRFAPLIETMGKLLVDRMRSYGRYIALHLRFEKDMLAFSGCTHGLSPEEVEELRTIRENTTWWKVKDIDPVEQRAKGYCPLTPKEVGIFLASLGYPSNTPIYIAAGEIYGGDSLMAPLRTRYPILMNKEKLATAEELEPFIHHATQMAALDYIVSVESDIFIPTYSGNMARAVEGHRRFLGHRKTILPDRKALVRFFDKIEGGTMKEGKNLSNRIIEIHKRRCALPTFCRINSFSSASSYQNPICDLLTT